MLELWDYCCEVSYPIILTGVPKNPSAAIQKRAWVKEHFGHERVITCASREKCDYAKKGDVLIDDWTKYQHLWEAAGGIFVVHTSAATSIQKLAEIIEEGERK